MAIERIIMAEGSISPDLSSSVIDSPPIPESGIQSAEPNVLVAQESKQGGPIERWLGRRPRAEVLVKPEDGNSRTPEAEKIIPSRTANFDPSKIGEYAVENKGPYAVFIDPKTGEEVARRPRIEGGAGVLLTPDQLLEEARKPENQPKFWWKTLKDLHNLPNEEREDREDEYEKACRHLATFAHDKKLFRNSPEVTLLETQLIEFEKQEINSGNRTEEQKTELQDLLDALNKQQEQLQRVSNTLALRGKAPDLLTKDQWQDLEEEEKQLVDNPEIGIDHLRQEISSRTSSGFLDQRNTLKENIAVATQGAKDKAEEVEQKQLLEQLGEPTQWEREQEQRLLAAEDQEPNTTRQRLPTFIEELNNFNQNQDIEGVSKYFHEARKLGIFNMDDTLDKKYREWATALISHREVSPYDRYGGRAGGLTRKTFDEVQDEIIEYFDALLDPNKPQYQGKPQYIEHDSKWNLLRAKGVDSTVFKGIREEYVRRAQLQILASLYDLGLELKKQLVNPTTIDRIPGEWNVHKLESGIRLMRESQDIQERSKPLFYQESYYRIVLTGKNREEIDRGIDQAAESIIQSATTFSLEIVRQRIEQLMTAIKETQPILQVNETDGRVSETEAVNMARERQHNASNKLDFFILDWLSTNLLMDQFASYYSDRLRLAGDERLKLITQGHDGLDALAIHWLISPEFRLYHRPQGFKGQLYDDDQTHKFIRKLAEEEIVERLMEYDLKDAPQERDKYRQNLTYGPTIYEYFQNFKHKGIIPDGIIPDQIIPADPTGKKDPTQFFNSLSLQEKAQLLALLEKMSNEQKLKAEDRLDHRLLKALKPEQGVDIRRSQYEQVLKQVKAKPLMTLTLEDLATLRLARQSLAQAQQYLQDVRAKAKSAFDTADKILNNFGESTLLSAPSIIMENGSEIKTVNGEIIKRGDYISRDDAVLFYKYAILQEGVKGPDDKIYQCPFSEKLALIRYRANTWMDRMQKAHWDRSKTDRTFIDILPTGQQLTELTVKLAAGFEETGLTEAQFQAFQDAAWELRENGYNAKIKTKVLDQNTGQVVDKEKTFAEIMKMDELQPVLNNFLADYKSSESEFNSPEVLERVARGKFISIANVRKRLGLTGREGFEGTTQQQIDKYTQRIEDSRAFHAEMERLALFEATHDLDYPLGSDYKPIEDGGTPIIERGHYLYKFSPNRIDYGFQRPWGVKRLHHLKEFWYTNLRRTIPRGVDLVHALPPSLTALSRELAFDNFLQMCWAVGKMESIDNPSLVMMGDRHKDLVYLRGRGEGGIAESGGNWSKGWGFFEKLLVDSNGLWKQFPHISNPESYFKEIFKKLANGKIMKEMQERGETVIPSDTQENLVNYFQDTTLSRFAPVLMATEKNLAEDRQAVSAGSGYDENIKWTLRFIEWLLSEKPASEGQEKPASEGQKAREEGGMIAYKEVADIIKLITTPGTYKKGASIWDEVFRKITPSHSIRLPDRSPEIKYVALA